MSRRGRRELAAEHAPRTLQTGADREPRPSRADERQLTDAVRARERRERDAAIERVVGHLVRARSEIGAALDALPAGEPRIRKDLAEDLRRMRRTMDRIRGGDER